MLHNLNRLITLVASGDNYAFTKLYNNTKRGVYAFIYSYLKNTADTEDAMQTVYLKIKQSAHSFNQSGNGRAWILQIAKNYALDLIKKQGRYTSIETSPEVHYYDKDNGLGIVGDAMKKVLTEEEQRIIILHVLWGYRHREIGEILNSPTGTVTSKYKRAVEKLKIELKGGKN